MRIKEIKQTFLDACKEKEKEWGVNFRTEAGIKKVNIRFGSEAIWTTSHERLYANHLLVHINVNPGMYSNLYGNKKEKYYEVFLLLHSYWTDYAKVKNYAGVMFFTTNGFNEELKPIFEEFLARNIPPVVKKHYELRLRSFAGEIYFLGGVLSEQICNDTNRFYDAVQVIEHLFERNPLLTIADNFYYTSYPLVSSKERQYTLGNMYHSPLLVHYFGFTYELRFLNNYNEVSISSLENSSVKFIVKNDMPELERTLQQLQYQNRLANLINMPRINFEKVLTKFMYVEKPEDISYLFEQVIEQVGSWEVVESESVALLKENSGKADEYKIHDVKDSVSGKEIKVTKVRTTTNIYYFIKMLNPKESFDYSYDILITTDEKPEKIGKTIGTFLYGKE